MLPSSTIFSSNQDAFIEWTFGQRFKEDCLVLDSFVALPLAAKLSMAAVPGNGILQCYTIFVHGAEVILLDTSHYKTLALQVRWTSTD